MTNRQDLIAETRERLHTGLNPGGRQVYAPDDEDRMRRLADALEAVTQCSQDGRE